VTTAERQRERVKARRRRSAAHEGGACALHARPFGADTGWGGWGGDHCLIAVALSKRRHWRLHRRPMASDRGLASRGACTRALVRRPTRLSPLATAAASGRRRRSVCLGQRGDTSGPVGGKGGGGTGGGGMRCVPFWPTTRGGGGSSTAPRPAQTGRRAGRRGRPPLSRRVAAVRPTSVCPFPTKATAVAGNRCPG